MADTFDLYQALWQRATQLGARVLYDGLEDDGAGWFHPQPGGRKTPCPTIGVGRRYYEEQDRPSRFRNEGGRDLNPPDLLHETVTLAHECGHFLSWKERTPRVEWDAYFGAVVARDEAWSKARADGLATDDFKNQLRAAAHSALTDEQRQLILDEEQRAWTIGRELLHGLGFDNFVYYAERERKGLHFHRYRLGIDELWAND